VLTPQSVLAVLGKPSAVSAIERLDLRIYDPEGGLRAVSSSASSNANSSVNGTRSATGAYEEDDYMDMQDMNIRESVLVVRLVCKHGEYLFARAGTVWAVVCTRPWGESTSALPSTGLAGKR
jgi:hypothetical protein